MAHFLRMRPPLRLQSSSSVDDVLSRLRLAAQARGSDINATFADHYVVLRIAGSRRHFGSPQLSFDVEADESGSVVTGLFMPMPSIWTAFMALYGLIVFCGLSGTLFGAAQMQLGQAPYALWAIPLSLVLLVLVYVAACVGQKMGAEQMQELQQFVEPCLLGET
jgi:hypothetical protein